jgi:hypothetical protein
MTINLFNAYGIIDLDLIRDDDVNALDEPRKAALEILIAAVLVKAGAEQRKLTAVKRVHGAMISEDECQRLHLDASPPPSQIEALRTAQDAYRASH